MLSLWDFWEWTRELKLNYSETMSAIYSNPEIQYQYELMKKDICDYKDPMIRLGLITILGFAAYGFLRFIEDIT